MLRRLEASHDHVLGYSIGGNVTDAETQQVTSELRDAIAMHGRIRLLFRLSDLSLRSFLSTLDEPLRFIDEHASDIERTAVVSDDRATEWLSKLSDAMASVEMRHFPRDEESTAWAWLE